MAIKIFTKKEIAPILVLVITGILGASLYTAPCLTKVPVHWNAKGEIDGYASKTFSALFFPLLILAIYLIMLFLPKIDPLKENYQYFEKQYYFIRLALILFMAGLYFFTFLTAMGMRLNIMYFMVPFLSALFVAFGFLMPKIKKNYFVGIRTPWTLQSDEVWTKTHKFAGKSMIIGGVLALLAVFFGSNAFWVFMIVIIIAALLPILYSYIIFRKMGLFKR